MSTYTEATEGNRPLSFKAEALAGFDFVRMPAHSDTIAKSR
jgi:hypothetical protein